jgi:BirA family biotin operon repressor/biotin-[acetyl-CoA-carboxylase] ligase
MNTAGDIPAGSLIAAGAAVPAAARAPLRPAALRGALTGPGALWREVRVVTETGSTNADLLADAAIGAAEGIVLAAESQTAGRGRLGRRWASPPRAALTFSVLLRPRGGQQGLGPAAGRSGRRLGAQVGGRAGRPPEVAQ